LTVVCPDCRERSWRHQGNVFICANGHLSERELPIGSPAPQPEVRLRRLGKKKRWWQRG
jgi:hypothetical protein